MYLSLKKGKIFKMLSACLIFVFVFSSVFPKEALASRSSAGGGKVAKFDAGKLALNLGISIGSAVLGSVLSYGISNIFSGSEGATTTMSIPPGTLELPDVSKLSFSPFLEEIEPTTASGFEIGEGFNLNYVPEGASSITPIANRAVLDFGGTTTSFTDRMAGNPLPVAWRLDVNTTLYTTGFEITPNIGGEFNLNYVPEGARSITPITNRAVLLMPTNTSPSFLSKMGGYFTKSLSLPKLAQNYNTWVATSQVGRAVGAAGSYYGWSPSLTFMASSFATGATGGFLNPSVALGKTITDFSIGAMAKGALVGSLTGLASSGVTVAIDGDKMNKGKAPGALAQIGGMVAGVAAGNLGRALVSPTTWSGESYIAKSENAIPSQTQPADLLMGAPELPSPSELITKDAAASSHRIMTYETPSGYVVATLNAEGNVDQAVLYDKGSEMPVSVQKGELLGTPNDTGTAITWKDNMGTPRFLTYDTIDGNRFVGRLNQEGVVVQSGLYNKEGSIPVSIVNKEKLFLSTPNDTGTAATWREHTTNTPQFLTYQTTEGNYVIANLNTKGEAIQSSLYDKETRDLISRVDSPQDKYKFYIVKKVDSGKIIPGTEDKTDWLKDQIASNPDKKITHLGGPYYKFEFPSASVPFEVSLSRIAESTFLKTLDMWPQLATRSLSILASQASKNYRWISPMASFVVDGLVGPTLSRAQSAFDLRLGTSIGEDRIQNSIKAYYAMADAAAKSFETNLGQRGYKEVIQKANMDEATSREKLEEIARQEGLSIKLPEITIVNNKIDQKAYIDNLEATLKEQKLEQAEITTVLDNVRNMFEGIKESGPIDPKQFQLGTFMMLIRQDVNKKIEKAEDLNQVFAITKTSRQDLFLNNAFGDIKYGLLEGVVNGGVSMLLSKLSAKKPALASALAFGGTQLTGILRGAVLYETWEESKKDGVLVWMPRDWRVAPADNNKADWLAQAASYESLKLSKEKYKEFGELSGLKEDEKPLWLKGEETRVKGYEVEFSNQRPGLDTAILASLAQSNQDFITRAWSFGAPLAKPENIDALMMSDYFRQLQGYGSMARQPNWLANMFQSGTINGGAYAISNNVLTSMAAYKPLADAFNMQRIRLVQTNIPNYPVTLQILDERPWSLGYRTGYYIPFPNEAFRPRNKAGKTFLRDVR